MISLTDFVKLPRSKEVRTPTSVATTSNDNDMEEVENETQLVITPAPIKYVDGHRVYGFILVTSENNDLGAVSHIFGVCKKRITLGRGSNNDIRLNSIIFSRLHATLDIGIVGEGMDEKLRVKLFNESSQKNAVRAFRRDNTVLPNQCFVYLDSQDNFYFHQRRFKWVEFDGHGCMERVEKMCPHRPIVYLRDDNVEYNSSYYFNMVQHVSLE